MNHLNTATLSILLLLGVGEWCDAQDVVYNDNVVIVLDASGSMSRSMRKTGTVKMAAAKMALKEVLKHVPRTTHIGLLVFSSKNLRDDVLYPLGPRDDAALMRAIDIPQPGRGTPLGAYIKKGADMLLEERERQLGYGTYRLLIVTDGEADDKKLVNRFTPEVISRGIIVDVIGVDMKGTHTLATKATSYRRADDPASLKQAVAEVFAEVSGSNNDATSDEAFAIIAPLPSETAQAMLAALSVSGNQPIGKAISDVSESASPPIPERASATPPTPPRPPPSQQPDGRGERVKDDSGWHPVFVILVFLAAATVFVRKQIGRKQFGRK